MSNNNGSDCCNCGMKYALCILQDIISTNIVKDYKLFYSCGESDTDAQLKDSKYPNFILLEKVIEEGPPEVIRCNNICINDLDYVRIEPNDGDSAKIINELNKYYISPCALHVNCKDDCGCKNSIIAYMKNKYMDPNWESRQFRVRLRDENYVIPEQMGEFITIIHMDYDIAWLWNQETKNFYLVSLCKICSLVDLK